MTRPSTHRVLRVLLVAAALALGLLAGPGVRPAAAHAYLTATSPTDGASLGEAPTQLRLEFSEHVVPQATHIAVTDAAGHLYAVTGLRAERSPAAPDDDTGTEAVDTEEPLALVADLPALPNGAYHVQWETLSSDDLHRTAGGFAFGVNTAVAADSASGTTETPPDLVDALGRWAVLAGLALALGAVLVRRLLPTPAGSNRRLSSRLRTAGVAGALAAASLGAVCFALDLARVGGSVITSSYAARWALREAALLLLVLTIAKGARLVWIVAATLLACVGTVLLGHTGLRGGPLWTVASALHLGAGAAWFGAVTVLAWLALRHRSLGLETGELKDVLRGFFRPAAVLVATVAVTGLYLASDVVVSADAVIGTTYGQVLLAKTLVVAAAGLLALVTSRRLHHHPHIESALIPIDSAVVPIESAARRRIALEATGLGIALALAAVLASGQPAISPTLVDSTGPAPSRILDQTAGSLQLTLVVAPNHPGDSVVTLDVFDARRPSPGPVTGVSVALPSAVPQTATAPIAAHRVSQYRWAAGVSVPHSGVTPITVTVHRQGLPPTVTTFDWVVGTAAPTPAVVVSRAPISGLLQTAALVLLLALALALALRLATNRRKATSRRKATNRRKATSRREATSRRKATPPSPHEANSDHEPQQHTHQRTRAGTRS